MNKFAKTTAKVFAMLLLVAAVATFMPAKEAFAATSYANRYSVVQTAYKYLGRPYVFGATGPTYFDCSGFTRYVYRQHGIYLPRTAAAQSTVGRYVYKSQLTYGDLVFFKNTYKYGISHVGIYVGNGKIIHAFPNRGVTVDRLSNSYLTAKYAGAKRVLR